MLHYLARQRVSPESFGGFANTLRKFFPHGYYGIGVKLLEFIGSPSGGENPKNRGLVFVLLRKMDNTKLRLTTGLVLTLFCSSKFCVPFEAYPLLKPV
ncbi:hypothetical protein L596_024812 [Steinernema carpocapsae]|uniref:Uncharacterized protein n=1 Tax=Steinernema carpocapsae TaxID=34508 RepID=A0A4U5M608_STECR|nr:hypothetical protein L596_024812 [Steinernema carpocapsae]